MFLYERKGCQSSNLGLVSPDVHIDVQVITESDSADFNRASRFGKKSPRAASITISKGNEALFWVNFQPPVHVDNSPACL